MKKKPSIVAEDFLNTIFASALVDLFLYNSTYILHLALNLIHLSNAILSELIVGGQLLFNHQLISPFLVQYLLTLLPQTIP
jgi:hypothetical protein